jgi:hypothetical protein
VRLGVISHTTPQWNCYLAPIDKPILGSRVVWPTHLRDPLWEIMRMRHFRNEPGESEIVREWVMT